jgi:prolyl 4-hydroxylase
VCVKPEKGAALLFYDLLPDGKTADPASLHTGCPTLKGTKWSATKVRFARDGLLFIW